jgi:hypothetical protein
MEGILHTTLRPRFPTYLGAALELNLETSAPLDAVHKLGLSAAAPHVARESEGRHVSEVGRYTSSEKTTTLYCNDPFGVQAKKWVS